MPADKGIFKQTLARIIKIFIVFLILAVFNSFLQVFVIFQTQEIYKVKAEIGVLEKEISRTKVEMASLESFDRIQSIALNELGMRAPNPDDFRWIEVMPVVNDDPSVRNTGMPETARADLWGHLYQWLGNVGKTMAQSL